MKKYRVLWIGCSFLSIVAGAQPGAGYRRTYGPPPAAFTVSGKNFYLLTVIRQQPEMAKLLSEDSILSPLLRTKRSFIQTGSPVDSVLTGLCWSREDSVLVDKGMRSLYAAHTLALDRLIDGHLRPGGYYQRFIGLSNVDLLMRAWGQYFQGINAIIKVYGLGKKGRYPSVDSASYDVRGEYYTGILQNIVAVLREQATDMNAFYEPSLQLALHLLDANDRDEPARYEPLEQGENKAAVLQAKKTNWAIYTYSAILVPGEGPERLDVPLSPGGKLRCELAAVRYKKGVAPFIIVSGGNVHPFHTPYNEAVEMKKQLMVVYHIPESAILIEPQARHTTTNFRNANRLMIRYGMPMDKPALCVTTVDQAGYIDDARFDARNVRELGYLPYRDKQRLSPHEIKFFPVLECLHMDPNDPLDP